MTDDSGGPSCLTVQDKSLLETRYLWTGVLAGDWRFAPLDVSARVPCRDTSPSLGLTTLGVRPPRLYHGPSTNTVGPPIASSRTDPWVVGHLQVRREPGSGYRKRSFFTL